ncbi:MAG TPA: hypothetical protein VGL91_24125 [Acidobacteriota bacterium]|jgi:hypothetical protein
MRRYYKIDPIPSWKVWGRKLITFKTVCEPLMRGSNGRNQLIVRMTAIQKEATRSPDLSKKAVALWRLENLGASLLRHAHSGSTLSASCLPSEICPVAHSGMGVAAVELAGFDAASIPKIIESFANSEYAPFCYESVGAMLALYKPDLFFRTVRCFARLGLVPLTTISYPDPDRFLASFPHEVQRLISHGYGRLLYFKNASIASAIRSAQQLPFLQLAACVQGIAFAYLMVNSTDLERVLLSSQRLDDLAHGTAFKSGLIYALEFLEWLFPGTLDSLQLETRNYQQPILAAQREILSNRSSGALAAFKLLENVP